MAPACMDLQSSGKDNLHNHGSDKLSCEPSARKERDMIT